MLKHCQFDKRSAADSAMSPENVEKSAENYEDRSETNIQNVLLMTEIGMDLKERYISGEKYICHLKSLINGADKAIASLQVISKSCLDQAKRLLDSIEETELRPIARSDYVKLKGVVDTQLAQLELKRLDVGIEYLGMSQISEKIKNLESRQKNLENHLSPTHTYSNKNIKADIDEKYPENLSRESLIDLSTINLPPVPEDIFTSFSNKPTRSSSLSSLKSMRKIKLHLQKAESSDDEDSSDNDDHEYSKIVYGDSDDSKGSSLHSPLPKKLLGNIKEETQD